MTRVGGILGQKMGYDRCPYLSFFIRIFEDGIFNLMGRRDLNTEYTIFDLRCYECSWYNYPNYNEHSRKAKKENIQIY